MEVESLIKEMQAVKAAHSTLELKDILSMFQIQALKNLTIQIKRLINK